MPREALIPERTPRYQPYPKASRWDVRLAGEILRSAGLSGADSACAGFSAAAEGQSVRIVWIPRPSPGAPCETHRCRDAALDAFESAVSQGGFTDVRRFRHSVLARAAIPGTPQTTARLRRVGALLEFRRSVVFEGYAPQVAGGAVRLASHGASPTSNLIVTDAQGEEVGRSYADHRDAVEGLAHHYGLPMPVTLVDEGRPA
ncbi:hypothetical protein [Streptomyces sp. NPDC055912]|uniref:hypothetical protein n=1 Tax=Streptomyces sp. NPDC055912 TaxID=3345660 RepID=UPI0035DAA402